MSYTTGKVSPGFKRNTRLREAHFDLATGKKVAGHSLTKPKSTKQAVPVYEEGDKAMNTTVCYDPVNNMYWQPSMDGSRLSTWRNTALSPPMAADSGEFMADVPHPPHHPHVQFSLPSHTSTMPPLVCHCHVLAHPWERHCVPRVCCHATPASPRLRPRRHLQGACGCVGVG